jgi:hypothetical protein
MFGPKPHPVAIFYAAFILCVEGEMIAQLLVRVRMSVNTMTGALKQYRTKIQFFSAHAGMMKNLCHNIDLISLARVVKLVDAGDSKSPAARRAGSIPAPGTSKKRWSIQTQVANKKTTRLPQYHVRCTATGSILTLTGGVADKVRI